MADGLPESRLCRIEQALGHNAICGEECCPFWETGNTARSGSCVFEELDLSARHDIAQWLEDLRKQLETSKGAPDGESRRLFYARLNAGKSD
jgi:hypothetical protein